MKKIICCWKWIRGTLIFNIIVASILVAAFLMALFFFLPSEAQIAIEDGRYIPENIFRHKRNFFLSSKTCNIYLSNIKCSWSDSYDVKIRNCDVIVDDAVYDASQLIIEDNLDFRISVPAETEMVIMSSPSLYAPLAGDIRYMHFFDLSYIYANNPFYIETVYEKDHLFVKTDTGIEPIDRCKIEPHDFSAVMDIRGNNAASVLAMSSVPWEDGAFKKLLVYCDVITAEITMDGTVNFMYTLDPHIYPIFQQELKLENEGEGLNAIIEGNGDGSETIKFYGKVTKASIGNRNLFPSFRKWFVDNAYLAPATILATFMSATTLVMQRRKKDE